MWRTVDLTGECGFGGLTARHGEADQDLGEDLGDGAGGGVGEALEGAAEEEALGECSEGYLMATSLERTWDSMVQLLASLLAPDWDCIKRWPI